MNIVHPLEGTHKTLTLSPELRAFVGTLPDLPTLELKRPYVKDRWEKMGIAPVPAGTYSDHRTPEAVAAIEKVYHFLKGAPITRPLMAMALGFVSGDHVDRTRDDLYKRGADVTRGAPGVSARSLRTPDVIAAQAAKRKAERAAKKAEKAA